MLDKTGVRVRKPKSYRLQDSWGPVPRHILPWERKEGAPEKTGINDLRFTEADIGRRGETIIASAVRRSEKNAIAEREWKTGVPFIQRHAGKK